MMCYEWNEPTVATDNKGSKIKQGLLRMLWEGVSEELICKKKLRLLELRDIIAMCKGSQVEKSLVISGMEGVTSVSDL